MLLGKNTFYEWIYIKYNKDIKSWYYYCYGEECKKNIFKIGKENVYDEEDVSSIIENMDNNDYFDPYLVYKLDNRVVENPYIIEKKIIEYFNKFFYLLKNSSGVYVEIYKNKYYIRKTELMYKEFIRFNMFLIREKDNS